MTTTSAISGTIMTAKLSTPEVKKNKITFCNSKDKTFVLSHDNGLLMDKGTLEHNINWAMSVMTIFNKFFDKNSGNIPAGKIFDIGTEIDTRFTPSKGGRGVTINWNQVLRNALNDMTNPNSDGGANITENEIYDYYERCAKILPNDNRDFSLKEKNEY